jgi:8-oxo-dGTP pyrophosphatase MutT (NUDIX family)
MKPSGYAGRAAAVALVRDGPGGIEVYLSKRPPHFRYYPGAFVVPGGRLDSEDNSITAAACREVREEIGVEIDPEKLVLLRETFTSAHAGPVYHLFIFAYRAAGDLATILNPGEVEEEIWITSRNALTELELPYQIRAAVHAIAGFKDVTALLDALRHGSINEDIFE